MLEVSLLAVLTLASAAATATSTDSAQAPMTDEVIVTARLREEAVADVPFSIVVLDASELRLRRVDDTLSMFRQVPGLSLTSFDDGRFAYFQLRGIGPLSQAISSDDGSVVTYIDGVPQPVYASELAYLDLQRLEVLRGPQGTLFGRNSQGGALNISTRPSSERLQQSFRAEGGENESALAQWTLSGPIGSRGAAGTLALRASTFGGFIANTAPNGGELGDRDSYAARGTLNFGAQDADSLRIKLSANLDHQVSDPFYYVLRGTDADRVELGPENRVRRTAWGASVTVVIPRDSLQLTSITALNGFRNKQVTDDTDGLIYGPLFGLPASAFLPRDSFSDWRETEKRIYQELRAANVADSDLKWAAGAVYFRSNFEVDLDNRSSFSPFLNGDRDATQDIDSLAAYGEATVPLGTERLQGTLGARYTRDEKRLDAAFVGSGFPGAVANFAERSNANFDLWTGRAALNYAAADDVNVYATVARGAKSGGFPRFTLSAALGAPSRSYAEATSWTYEIGVKSNALGGRGKVELAAFCNDVTDEQLFVLDFVSFQFLPVNLDTRSCGLETQGSAKIGRAWTVDIGAQWTRGRIEEADATSGAERRNRIPNVARFSSSTNIGYAPTDHATGVTPLIVLSHQYVGRRAADVANSFDLGAYHNVDLRAGIKFRSLEWYLFARNLLDERQELNGVLYGPGVEGASLARGRVAGIGITGEF
jgi:iron complex outermembrane recepter protein